MSAQDLEQRARELLAAEYEAAGESWAIWGILNSPHEQLINSLRLALRAIVAALRQQPAPVDLEQFRLPVEAWKSHLDPNDDDESEAYDEADRLLSIIDNAGKVASAEPVATVCLVGERYAHGNMVEVQLQLVSADAPSPKTGDRYYAHHPAPVVDDAMRELIQKWRKLAEQHGVRTFTGNDHALFANELEAALARAQGVQP